MKLLRRSHVGPASLLLQAALAVALMAVLCAPKTAAAQHHGGGPGGGGFGGGMPGGGMSDGGMRGGGDRGGFERSSPDFRHDASPRIHASLQVGPPGRWWDDKHFVKQLRLSPDQQRHMDAIFEQNKGTLVKRFETLQQEEQRMDSLTHAKTLDEPALFAQIDRIEQARADLGKATVHYLVQLRSELDQDQIVKLDNQQ